MHSGAIPVRSEGEMPCWEWNTIDLRSVQYLKDTHGGVNKSS